MSKLRLSRVDAVSTAQWIELDGTVNMRDLGGLPTTDGRVTRPGRLIRSDNLQDLSDEDVRALVDDVGVRAVADLRTLAEVAAEGGGRLDTHPAVEVLNLSLFPESGEMTDVAADDAPVVLPWQEIPRGKRDNFYLGYLEDRPDSVLAALRLIAGSPGATVVHCAAGKDRTGVVVALTLSEVGVQRTAIVADYADSAERFEQVIARLRATRTYADDLESEPIEEHRPRAETMQRLLDLVDSEYGGPSAWLRANGWTDADAAALRHKLLD
jgi:protein-tyrosine phosphatase